jgi:hypothetical protein
MPVNFDALRRGRGADDVPANGQHIARLEKAIVLDTRRGTQLKCEWTEVSTGQWWSTWDTLEDSQWAWRAADLLGAFGIDLAEVTDEEDLAMLLAEAEGGVFEVTTDTQFGDKGGAFVHVLDPRPSTVQGTQLEMPPKTDVPVPKEELQPAATSPTTDDDIPF